MSNRLLSALSVVALGTVCFACEEEPKQAAVAEPTPSAAAAPAEPVAPPSATEEPKKTRPASIDSKLTDERRAELEKAYPETKAFVLAQDIEDGLKKNKALKEEKNALKAFDAKVKGKWMLFTGTMVNLTDTGFDMAIVYTPQLPNDPIGMSRQFFTVTFSDVEGYARDKFEVGSAGVVLAKYNGAKQASPGREVVETGHWK